MILANLSFMKASWNRSKSKTDLETWLKENTDKTSFIKMLPADTSYKLINFDHFYALRRSLMKYSLTKLFGIQKETINVGDEVTLNISIVNGQFEVSSDLRYGMHGHVISLDDVNQEKMALIEFEDDNGVVTKQRIPEVFLYIVEPFDKELEMN